MRIHGNYMRKTGKRSGRKPNWYRQLEQIRNRIDKALNAFDSRPRR